MTDIVKLKDLIIIVIGIIAAPIAGALAVGLEDALASLLTGRRPQPLLRPVANFLHDFRRPATGRAYFQLVQMIQIILTLAAISLLLTQDDLLLAVILFLTGSLMRLAAAGSLNSPYARIGAQYEGAKFLVYAPVLILVCVNMKLVEGTFILSGALGSYNALVSRLPLVFVVLLSVIPAKLGKSPFNFSRLSDIETSGRNAAWNALAGWLDRVFLYALVFIFILGGFAPAVVAVVLFVALMVVGDVFFPDVKPYFFLKWGSLTALLLIGINMLWIFLGGLMK